MVKVLYNKELFSDFSYDETSATYLRCKKTGRECGSLETNKGFPKAARLWVKNRRYLIHRVIWVLKYGGIDPELDIDHIDGNPWNNSIKNLRLVEKRLNQRNRKKMANNKTGVNGVFFHKTSNNSGGTNTYLRVVWVSIDKQRHRDFNIKIFKSIEDAVEFGELFRQMILEERDSYTERHGQ